MDEQSLHTSEMNSKLINNDTWSECLLVCSTRVSHEDQKLQLFVQLILFVEMSTQSLIERPLALFHDVGWQELSGLSWSLTCLGHIRLSEGWRP